MVGEKSSHDPFKHNRLLTAAAVCMFLATLGPELIPPARSQTLNDQVSSKVNQQKGRLLVDAKEIVYDNDKNRVEARGDVQLYYQGRVLEADRVIYDRNTKRVYAEGNAKLVEANGNTIYSDRFELTDDFKDGFIDSLRVVSPDKQRITAARGERTDGETTVFERGTYTACEPCKDYPERPPLWQIRAARIIAKNSEQMIYYEDARLEFFGLPLAYIPYLSAPDPTVSRKSGLLAPRFSRNSTQGFRYSQPIYWAPAQNYDVLWTPSALSKQGMLNEVEWRHRLETGVYNIRAAGIFQADPRVFLPGPFGPNKATFLDNGTPYPTIFVSKDDKRVFRGSIETTGKFLINKNWNFGWDVLAVTDKFFLGNYRVKSESSQVTYFKESISSVYLRGQTEKAFFDASAFYIQGQTQFDWQRQMPVVHPSVDFNRRFQLAGIGGELGVDVNITSLSRDAADYNALPPAAGGVRFASSSAAPSTWRGGPTLFNYLLNSSVNGVFSACALYQRGDCLLRGIAGTTSRASTVISWRRNFIDPVGQVWTPFVSAQVDVLQYSLNTTTLATGLDGAGGYSIFGNDKQANFLPLNDTGVRAMPSVGLEYRFPFAGSSGGASHLFEPMAQIIASPNETMIGRLPNEDSQSLVFSDSNLFSLNRFSGYDRTEGGVRANVGAQYTMTFATNGYVNALVGQSYHLAGRNSFQSDGLYRTDLVNTGLQSGLDKSRSDYVGRVAFAMNRDLSFVARGRFDSESLSLQRLEFSANTNLGPFSASVLYARQEAQPDLGYVRRREGISLSGAIQFPNYWSVSGNIVLDLDRYTLDRDLYLTTPSGSLQGRYNNSPIRPSGYGLGLKYADECTIFSVNYLRTTADNLGATNTTNTTVLFRLELKHLGQVNYRQAVNPSASPDGTR
jgi:LPS-assembly protein